MKKLLIVVDMINGFINQGALHDRGIQKIIPACETYIAKYLEEGQDVIAFCDAHQEDSKEFGSYPLHCLAGSKESELVDELKSYSQQLKLIFKNSTNGFFAPGFQEELMEIAKYQEILLVGCCTDICVLQLALSLKAYCNEKNYDIDIVVDELACETFDIAGHERKDYNAMAYTLMGNAGIKIIKGQEDE